MTGTNDMGTRRFSRRRMLGTAGLAGAAVLGSGAALTACGSGSGAGPGGSSGNGGSGGASGAVTWGSWANPGEGERFKTYSKDYGSKVGASITWQQVVGDYQTKILTQLAGGSAPDAFYVGDTSMKPIIDSGKILPLDDYLSSSDSATKLDTVYEGLRQWCISATDGKTYGVPVDCNPKTFWFSKGLLQEAGVTTDPAAAFEAGTWNRDALDDLLVKVKATGKRGMVLEANWFDLASFITTFGGTAFEEDKAVFDTDSKAQEILAWLFDHIKAGTITYGGSLPKGQGVDALFYGGQLATIQYGRWILPNLKKLKNITYDIAPMPSEDGKTVMPVGVYVAAMSVNANAKNKDAALAFMANFVSQDGEKARLSGGGNAVPALAGIDDIVTDGGLPEHASYFIDIAKAGYAVPPVIARNADVGTNFGTKMDTIIKSGADSKTFATQLANFVNNGGK